MLLIPMAGLAIGLVQTTNNLAPELGMQVAAIVLAAVAVFETIGPPIAAYALRMTGEAGARSAGPEAGLPASAAKIASSPKSTLKPIPKPAPGSTGRAGS